MTATTQPSTASPSVGLLARERSVAPGFNRWLIPPAALAVHLCIGQAYATSVYKTALVKHFDATLTAIGVIFSIAIVMLGLSAAVMGTWVDRNGPRNAMFAAALLLGHRVPRRRPRHRHRPAVAAVPRVRRHRRHRARHRLHLAGLDADQVVPRPAGPGHRHGDHGLRRRRARREPGLAALLRRYDSGYDPTDPTSVASGQAVAMLFVTLGVVYFAVMMSARQRARAAAGVGAGGLRPVDGRRRRRS